MPEKLKVLFVWPTFCSMYGIIHLLFQLCAKVYGGDPFSIAASEKMYIETDGTPYLYYVSSNPEVGAVYK